MTVFNFQRTCLSVLSLGLIFSNCGEKSSINSRLEGLREDSPKLRDYTNVDGASIQQAWNVQYFAGLTGKNQTLYYAEFVYNNQLVYDEFGTPSTLDGTFSWPQHSGGVFGIHHNWENNSPFNTPIELDQSFRAVYRKRIIIQPYAIKAINMRGASDDGIKARIYNERTGVEVLRIWDSGQPMVSNFWNDHSYTAAPAVGFTFPQSSQSENYILEVSYYENTGFARFDFDFNMLGSGPVTPPATDILAYYGECGGGVVPNCANFAGVEPDNRFNLHIGQCRLNQFEIWEVIQKNGMACKVKCTIHNFTEGVSERIDGLANFKDNNSLFVVKRNSDNKQIRVDVDNKIGDQYAYICP